MKTSERLKEITKQTGLKQYIIAERCGYTPKVFNQLINGRKPILDKDIIKICTGLGITPNDLIILN